MASKEELIKAAEAKFDKENLIKAAEEKWEASEKPGYGESMLRGGAQGLTFGYEPQLRAAVQSPFSDKKYEDIRDEETERNKLAQETNPNTYLASELGGGAASIAIPGVIAGRFIRGTQAARAMGALGGLSEAAPIAKESAGLLRSGGIQAMKLARKYGPGFLLGATGGKIAKGLME